MCIIVNVSLGELSIMCYIGCKIQGVSCSFYSMMLIMDNISLICYQQ